MPRALRLACWLLSLLIAGLQAFASRHVMNPDALSYLDLARAFLAQDFERAVSPYFGPLYPFLLALGLSLARPSSAAVFPAVHAVNFVIFLVVLVAFDFFLRELLRARQDEDINKKPAVRDGVLVLFAYAVFIYSALGLIGLQMVTPDLCVAAVVFAAAGHVLTMLRQSPTWSRALLLGLILGLGYLSKSVMFVLGLVLVVSLPLSPALRSRGLRYVLLAGGAFAIAATFLIIPISRKAGSFTFGTSGNLTYAFMVNRVPYTNWQGNPFSRSELLHPPRRLSTDPEIFEYSAHLVGTYPAWFDPTYWTAGLSPEFRLSNQVRALFQTGGFYVNFFIGGSGAVATILVALIWLCPDCLSLGPQLRRQLPLITFGLAGLAIYFLVYVEPRYVAAFATLLWIVPIAAARRLEPREPVQWLNRAALICAACLVVPIGLRAAADAWESRRHTSPHPEVAAHLHGLGIQAGDRVANIGIDRDERPGSSFDAFWAYLARVQIVAEIPDGREFLCADEATAERVYSQLTQVGARAVVTMAMPNRWCSAGWQKVSDTAYYVKLLD